MKNLSPFGCLKALGRTWLNGRTFIGAAVVFVTFLCPIVDINAASYKQAYADSIYSHVDVLPYLKGHRKNTSKYLRGLANYPANLKVKGIESDVLVNFVVTKDGDVSNASANEGAHAYLVEEAVRVVMESGKWEPGQLNGKKVSSQMSMLISFRLSEDEKELANALKPIDFDKKPPLFIVDGRIVEDGVTKIDFYNVKSIRVIKGEKAISQYGDRAKNGVVEVMSKNGTPPVW
jgi:TonB family protein